MKFISVTDPKRLQHYRERNPPWIKLYRDLFSDPDFQKLPESARLQLLFLQTLVPEFDNKIPYDAKWLQGRMATDERMQIPLLAKTGWIRILEFATNGHEPKTKG